MKETDSSAPLIARLLATLKKERLIFFVAGLIGSIAALLASWVLLSILAGFVVLAVWFKISLIAVTILVTLVIFVRLALLKLLAGTIDNVAVRVEQENVSLKGRLIAAVQFSRLENKHNYSPELLEVTKQQAAKRADQILFSDILSFAPVWKYSRLFGATTVVALAIFFLFPSLFSYSWDVYSQPMVEVAPPIAYTVTPFPGSTEWVKHRDITVGAKIVGQRLPDEATLFYRLAGGSWQNEKLELETKVVSNVETLDSLETGLTLRQITRSFDYYVQAGRVETAVEHVDVVDRPRVTGIDLAVFYPKYTGLQPMTLNENNGSFSAIVGSRVNMKIETNLPIESAELLFDDSSKSELAVERNSGTVSLVVNESRSYHIRLVDHLGERNPDPIEYYVTAIPDEYPTVDVIRPGFDANLTDDMQVPFKIRLFDDFGFSSLALKYTTVKQGRPQDENVALLHFSEKIKTEGDINFNWDLNSFSLYPGDYVSYYFEVADNDEISGPKTGRSRTYIARLPSLDEIIAGAESKGEERIVKTEELLKSSKELAERLKNASRKLDAQNKNEKSDNWQEQKELESIAGKNQELLEQIETLSEQMDKSLEEMRDNALMSREIQEKMEQIQKLFEEIATPEMQEAQRKLMEALKNMDPQELEEAMRDFELSQEELLERLERTLALLKKTQFEQKMESMVRKAEELVEQQERMNDETESAEKESLSDLKEDEEKVRKGLENLKKEVEELKELAKEANLEESDEAKKFAEAVEKSDADKNMEKMEQSLEQKNRSEASQQGKKAKSKLSQMLNQMQQQQMAMTGNDDSELEKAMRRAIDDANYLSRSQEDLLRYAAAINPQSTKVRELAGDQQDIAKSSEGLKQVISELGRKSPFIAAELGQLLKSATDHMETAKLQFDSRSPGRGIRHQRDAMVDLNKASQRLMESMEQQQQSSSGGQCDKPTQSLESLSQRQNELNQETQKQGGNMQPNFQKGLQQREQLKRLAGEQGSIRKSLEQVEREMGGSNQIMGRLKDIAKEMKDIEESLESGDVGDDIRERQLKVYSRMLEASRSLQRKDFSEQRKSEVATNPGLYLPPELSESLLNDRTNIEDRLRRFLGNEYPAQYEEQIKAYFKALLKLETDRSTGAVGEEPSTPPSLNR